MLARLALNPGVHARARVSARFWPLVLDSSARGNLRTTLWSLRRSLRPAAPALRATRDSIGLSEEGVWVDAREFEALLAAGRPAEAVGLCRGELLADLTDDWVLEARDLHADRLKQALGDAALAADQAGDLGGATRFWRRLVELDPLDEQSCRSLMLALAENGDPAAALGAYERLAERLRAERRTVASPATRALVERLRTPATEDAPGPRPAFVSRLPRARGRERELELLRAEWKAARSGGGGVVDLRGEAGIGKTHLARALADEVGSDGGRVTVGAALALSRETAFASWLGPVRELLQALGTDAPWAADLAPLAPTIAAGTRPDGPPELQRARLLAAVSALVDAAAEQRPLLLVLEDVHQADAASLELAGQVARRATQASMLAVLTRREAPPSPDVDLLLDGLERGGVRLARIGLGRLDDHELRAVVGDRSALDAAATEAVVSGANGNPLLAVESARAIAAGQGTGPAPTLVEAVRGWLRDLGEAARAMLDVLAVAERSLRVEELVALPVSEPSHGLEELLASGLLDGDAERIGFRHELLRDAVVADIRAPRLRVAHRELGAVIEACADPRDGAAAAEVAAHLRRGGLQRDAAERLRRAARHARSTGSPAEAAALLRSALEIAESAELWLELADAEAWRGQVEAAEAAFSRVLDHHEGGDGASLAAAWVRRARWGQGTLCAPEIVRGSAERAIGVLEATGIEDAALWTAALGLGAWAEAVAGDVDQAEELLDALAPRAAGRPRDDLVSWETGFARAMVAIRRGHFDDGATELLAAARAAQRAQRPDLAQACWETAATVALCASERDAAVTRLEYALEAARGRGRRRVEVRIHGNIARILAALGRHSEAEDRLARAADAGREFDAPAVGAELDRDRGLVALAAGRLEEAEPLLASALDGALERARPAARLAQAEVLVGLGRVEDARLALRAATAEPVAPEDLPATLVPRVAELQARVATAEGDPTLAAGRLQEADGAWTRLIEGSAAGPVAAGLGRDSGIVVVDLLAERERVRAQLEAIGEEPWR